MQKTIFFSLFLFLISCSSTKSAKVQRDHGDCNVAFLNIDNKQNDTTKVRYIRGAVFDTTALLVHGYIINTTYQPVQNASVTLFSFDQKFQLTSDSLGEFEVFRHLGYGPWNLIVRHPDYVCSYIVDVVKTGGQWFFIKLEHK